MRHVGSSLEQTNLHLKVLDFGTATAATSGAGRAAPKAEKAARAVRTKEKCIVEYFVIVVVAVCSRCCVSWSANK